MQTKENKLEQTLEGLRKRFKNKMGITRLPCSLATWDMEYFHMLTSRTKAEYSAVMSLIMEQGLKPRRNETQYVDRTIDILHYYIIDSAFPVSKNFKEFRQSSKTFGKDKILVELNYYYILPALIYRKENVSYNEEKFYAQYTEDELWRLMDLLCSLVLGYIIPAEEQELVKLLAKDEVLYKYYREKADMYKEKATYTIEFNHPQYVIQRDITPESEMRLFRECICQQLSICNLIVQNLINESNEYRPELKALSDFRYIVAVEYKDKYTQADFEESLKYCYTDDYSIAKYVSPKIYYKDDALREAERLHNLIKEREQPKLKRLEV